MLGRSGHPVGQPGCALLAAPLHAEQDYARNAGCNDQDH
jgi:hypothetical protein